MQNLIKCLLYVGLMLLCTPAFNQDYNFQVRSSLSFPGQTLANVCGYAQNGKEYALLGGSKGLIIVDVTNPDAPQEIVQIPGPDNLWKEIKTYSHFAYVTSEGGQGIQIVDLSGLPSSQLNSRFYKGDGVVANRIDAIHALHIDVKRGFLYAYGGDNLIGIGDGAKIFNLQPDPYNPVYVGKYNQLGYVHDGYVENDTLYAAHINAGLLSMVDVSDKNNPVVLGTIETPGRFTHNSWILSDRKHVLTTDEKFSSFVTSYDVSNPDDIRELDRISTTRTGQNSIGHNTHILNDWAITSWYTDGVTIVDAHRPENLVEVARFDTWQPPVNLSEPFDGCWGAYPYLPSGNIITTNIDPAVMYVLTPNYVRACYLEGTVLNGCNGFPMFDAKIEVNTNEPRVNTSTKLNGEYKTGQVTPGNYTATISKPGYQSQHIDFSFQTAQVALINVTLVPENVTDLNGLVVDELTGAPISNAEVSIVSTQEKFDLKTDAAGKFKFSCVANTNYTITIAKWGYKIKTFASNLVSDFNIQLERDRYSDDFGYNLDWQTSGTSNTGQWTWCDPIGTSFNNGTVANPETDASLDFNNLCYATGNGGGQPGSDDVDDGSVTLTCPPMDLQGFYNATLSFSYWFYNGGGNSTPNDNLQVNARLGNQVFPIFTESVSASAWRQSGNIELPAAVLQNTGVQIEFIAADTDPGHVVEAAIDQFKVVLSGSTSVHSALANATLIASPNPSTQQFLLKYSLESPAEQALLEIRNVLGVLVFSEKTGSPIGQISCGAEWPSGIYFANLRVGSTQSTPLKLVKNSQ